MQILTCKLGGLRHAKWVSGWCASANLTNSANEYVLPGSKLNLASRRFSHLLRFSISSPPASNVPAPRLPARKFPTGDATEDDRNISTPVRPPTVPDRQRRARWDGSALKLARCVRST